MKQILSTNCLVTNFPHVFFFPFVTLLCSLNDLIRWCRDLTSNYVHFPGVFLNYVAVMIALWRNSVCTVEFHYRHGKGLKNVMSHSEINLLPLYRNNIRIFVRTWNYMIFRRGSLESECALAKSLSLFALRSTMSESACACVCLSGFSNDIMKLKGTLILILSISSNDNDHY